MTFPAGPQPPTFPTAAVPAAAFPASPAPPISARRAYTEVLIVFGLFFAASIISAGETLGGGVPAPSGGWGDFVPAAVQDLTDAAIAVIVVVLVCGRRGLNHRMLGLARPVNPDGTPSTRRAFRLAAIALIALVVGGAVTASVETGHLPQQAHPSGPYLLYSVAGSLFSGVVEEMVALTFVVSTLRQARRPVIEIVIVGVLLRCTYHIYYGVGVIGIAVWAAAFVLLYLRFNSVIPLIILHFLWDAIQFLGLKWPVVGLLGEAAGGFLLLAGLIIWLVDLVNRNASRGGPGQYLPGRQGPGVPVPPLGGAPYGGYPPPPGPGPYGTYPSGSPYPPASGFPPPGPPYPPPPAPPYGQQPPPGYTQPPPPGYAPPPGTPPPPPGDSPPGDAEH